MNEQDRLPDILATRVNFDVIAFRGCTRKELMIIGMLSFMSTALLVGILMKLLFGVFLIGVGIACPLSIAVGFVITGIMQKLKMGKPKGYTKQRLQLWLENKGVITSPFIRYSGKWSVRRHIKF